VTSSGVTDIIGFECMFQGKVLWFNKIAA